jgi:hypothetical protein
VKRGVEAENESPEVLDLALSCHMVMLSSSSIHSVLFIISSDVQHSLQQGLGLTVQRFTVQLLIQVTSAVKLFIKIEDIFYSNQGNAEGVGGYEKVP